MSSSSSSNFDLSSWEENRLQDFPMLDHGEASCALPLIEDANPSIVGDIDSASVVACRPRSDSFINAPSSPTIMEVREGIFVVCDEVTYNKGIGYNMSFVEDNFPVLWIILKDARICMRNAINVVTGTGQSPSALESVATQIISDVTVMAALLGFSVEKGKYYGIHDFATNPWQQGSRSQQLI